MEELGCLAPIFVCPCRTDAMLTRASNKLHGFRQPGPYEAHVPVCPMWTRTGDHWGMTCKLGLEIEGRAWRASNLGTGAR